MTAYAPSSTYPPPPHHSQSLDSDHYTPQSPPASFISGMMDKYPQAYSTASPPNIARPPLHTGSSTLLTPASSGAPNSAHEDMDVDESFSEENPLKRRRTYGSFDAERRSLPPNLRHSADADADANEARLAQIHELITQPDCSPYHLVLPKRLFPFSPLSRTPERYSTLEHRG